MTMISRPAELTPAILNKAVGRYYKELQDYAGQAEHELALRPAFQNLLAEMARRINLTLVHEMTIRGRIRPDGVLCDAFHIQRGYWEAKGPRGNLEEEIRRKIKDGYPLENALFENTRQAVLYQASQRYDFDLRVQADAAALLKRFLTYQKPDIANFEQAVVEFQGQIPNIAKRLLELINEEQQRNARFVAAFTTFADLCRTTLNPRISSDEIKEMLVQHLLTERLFRTVFDNPDFVNKNAIAAEIEKVIAALTSRSFNRSAFLRSLDPFYGAIEAAARGIETWSERQHFLNTVYERFFQGFAVQKADTLGIVYTPQEIVEFMVTSVDEVLKREFGKSQGLAMLGVSILDPCVGTGNFIVNVIKHIAVTSRSALREKYTCDLFCNEIALLPYYIASMNIEHEYYATMGEYVPFEGVCFVDTLELAEGQQLPLWVVEENTERIKREKEADIMVVMGNPPYNAKQQNQNDNNKNRLYTIVDQQIRQTYVKHSKATNRNALSDMYVKFFRWATDRLQGQDGVVCFVSNNSFIGQIAFDGMRSCLLKDFTQIYHLDLHGDVRKNPQLSGTKHNVFGIQVGVGITIAIRNSKNAQRKLFYHRVPEDWSKEEKFAFLSDHETINSILWSELEPDAKNNWLTKGIQPEFDSYVPLGVKALKFARALDLEEAMVKPIFKLYSLGVQTNRDNWVYDFNKDALQYKVNNSINTYNSEIDRWKRAESPENVDGFVLYDDAKLKWSRDLKEDLKRGRYAKFEAKKIRRALYRPFTAKYYFLDPILSQDIFRQPTFFPTLASEVENKAIIIGGYGRKHFAVLATNNIPDINFYADPAQCFPYYTYAKDGGNQRENITDWALTQFQVHYGEGVSKWDIFHYVYAMLHHPQYRKHYAENLKRDLPHIPLLLHTEAFQAAATVGQALMNLHINYEQQESYALTSIEDETVPYEQLTYVTKMKLTPDRTAVVVSKGLTLAGIPDACFRYRLGNRSALEWVIDQYQVSTDARSGITTDPNRLDDPEYIVRLVKQVVTVSVETVELVDQLAQVVTMEDWMEESEKNANKA
jgi:predicted helicase